MSSNAIRGEKRRTFLRRLSGILVVVAIAAAGFVTFQILRSGSAGPATAETTEVDADSTATDEDVADAKKDEGKDDDEERDERVPVEIAPAQLRDVPSYFSGTASLTADNAARILARTDGQIVALHVEEGDVVKKGDVLVELDGGEQKIALEERKADLITLEHELERQRAMFEKNLGSESDYLGTKARYEAAEARRRAAELRVGFTNVRAPFAGVVTMRAVDLGEHVTAGTEICHLADMSPLLGSIFMPENQVNRVSIGQPVEVRSDAAPSHTFTAHIQRVAPIVDSRTGTVKVTVELEGDDNRPLVPGSFVRVLIETDRHEDTLTIPKRAVVEQGGESFAFRIDEEYKAHRVRVETGYSFDDDIEVLSGLSAGDRIVTAGHGALRNDVEVRVIGEPDPRAEKKDEKPDASQDSDDGDEDMAQGRQGS